MSSAANRARRSNNPLAGLNLRTANGRLVRDLYRERMAAFDDDAEADATITLAVRRVVELQVIANGLRADLLAAPTYKKADVGELVRVENLVRRAEAELAKLVAEMTKEEFWYERAQRERNNQTS